MTPSCSDVTGIRSKTQGNPVRYLYNGRLSCLRAGISSFLPLSIASARATRRLVALGTITSSI